MRVLINDHIYEMGRKGFRSVLDIAKQSVPFGIYAVSKDGFCEMKKETFRSQEEMNTQIVDYQKQGFRVYFNREKK
jgi:hypothetical protein